MYYLIFFLWRKLNQSQLGMDGWLKKLNLKNLIMQIQVQLMMIMAEVAACKWGKQNKFWKLAQNAAKCCTTCILRNEIFARLVHHLHYFAKMYDILYSMGKMSSTWKAQNYYNLVLPMYLLDVTYTIRNFFQVII